MSSFLWRQRIVGLIAFLAAMAIVPIVEGATPAKAASKVSPGDAAKIWQMVRAELTAGPDDKRAIDQAIAAAKLLEKDSATHKLAIRAYSDLSAILRKSHNEDAPLLSAKFAGAARRLGLIGHSMKVFGTLHDGARFDGSNLEGKVVLVDFWATWCGPCRKELPNVKGNYEKYHDRGFEVVGVSLDDDADALEGFLAKNEIPWPVLMDNEATGAGWNSPLAIYYGVQSIPTAILIDQNGKVVSLNAKGENLSRRLEELLGK